MHYLGVILAAMASSTFVSAAPSQGGALSTREMDCPPGLQVCGTCSGDTCNFPDPLGPQPCEDGSCTADGNECGVTQDDTIVFCT